MLPCLDSEGDGNSQERCGKRQRWQQSSWESAAPGQQQEATVSYANGRQEKQPSWEGSPWQSTGQQWESFSWQTTGRQWETSSWQTAGQQWESSSWQTTGQQQQKATVPYANEQPQGSGRRTNQTTNASRARRSFNRLAKQRAYHDKQMQQLQEDIESEVAGMAEDERKTQQDLDQKMQELYEEMEMKCEAQEDYDERV